MTSWLRAQKKSELVDMAETVGLKNVSTLKKSELESALDEYLTENATFLSDNPKLTPYYNIRSKSIGSPVKREMSASDVKVPKRRQTKPAPSDDAAMSAAATTMATIATVTIAPPTASPTAAAAADDDDEDSASAGPGALIRTPARALSMAASRIALPASPADVAQAVDRGALAVRTRVSSLYADSGITEVTQATRESLSTVSAITLLVAASEWLQLRAEVLPCRYVFSVPPIALLGTAEYPVSLPDVFLLLTSSFWSPVALWLAISTLLPSLVGYFFNLSAASGSHHAGRGRSRPFSTAEYAVDPLTFSVTKALLVYVVLAQGISLGGWVDPVAVARINAGLYGSWQGAMTGAAITGLASLYDAVLRK